MTACLLFEKNRRASLEETVRYASVLLAKALLKAVFGLCGALFLYNLCYKIRFG